MIFILDLCIIYRFLQHSAPVELVFFFIVVPISLTFVIIKRFTELFNVSKQKV